MQSARVLVIGSSNTDLVLDCERLPLPGETLQGGAFHRFHGGKGANQAVAAARAGARVVFAGARGDDDFGDAAAKALRGEKIDVRHFQVREGHSSGVALIFVGGKTRENVIGVSRSANDTLSAADIEALAPEARRCQAIVTQLEIPLPAVIAAGKLARELGVTFILNPAPARALPKSLLRLVDVLTPNETEAALLTGEQDPETAGRALLKMGCRNVLITLGSKGALLVQKEGLTHFPTKKVRPVDTVGAGDCLNGWLAVGIAEGKSLAEAVPAAIRAASISVTRPGAQAGMPYREEVLGS